MSGAHQMCATESQEVGSGRERGQYSNDPAFASCCPSYGDDHGLGTDTNGIYYGLLPLVGAMMTAEGGIRRQDDGPRVAAPRRGDDDRRGAPPRGSGLHVAAPRGGDEDPGPGRVPPLLVRLP